MEDYYPAPKVVLTDEGHLLILIRDNQHSLENFDYLVKMAIQRHNQISPESNDYLAHRLQKALKEK